MIGGNKAHAKAAVESVLDNISEALARKEAVRLVGFGTFGVREEQQEWHVIPEQAKVSLYRKQMYHSLNPERN